MAVLSFSVPGEPRGKERPRGHARVVRTASGPKAVLTFHTPAETVAAEKAVLIEFRRAHPRHEPFTGPVMLKFVAVFPIPDSWPKRLKEAAVRGTLYCVKKPDKDNIEKLIVDALSPPKRKPGEIAAPSTRGYAWVDDQQVMGGGVKRYGHPARVDVTIESLEQPDVPPTPGQQRLEARVAAGEETPPPRAKRRSQTKSRIEHCPDRLRRAIDAALARDGRK